MAFIILKIKLSNRSIYRFLENPNFNWRKFLYLISLRLIHILKLHYYNCNVLIIDDTVIDKSCSSKVELLAKVFDHVNHKFVKGFYLLTLAFSNCFYTFALDFSILSSDKPDNRYKLFNSNIDRRTVYYKRATDDAVIKKTHATIKLIKNAVSIGINVSYVL